MARALTLDPDDVAERLSCAAYHRALGRRLANAAQSRLSPEDAAADEFDREEQSYQALGAIELFSVEDQPRVPTASLRASNARAAYIKQRAEEIRAERATTPEPSHGAMPTRPPNPEEMIQQELAEDRSRELAQRIENVAEEFLAQWETKIDRTLTPTEHAEMMAWLRASAQASSAM